MEVHAHSHTPRRKWTHYFWEFLMLFLAVSAGFLVENFREHYIEHKRAKELALSLYEEMRSDSITLEKTMENRKDKEKHLKYLGEYLRDSSLTNLSREFYPRYTWALFATSYIVFDPKDGILQQLKNSGSLRYFRNMEIQKAIGDFSVALNNLKTRYERETLLTAELNRDFLLRHYDYTWLIKIASDDNESVITENLKKYVAGNQTLPAIIKDPAGLNRLQSVNHMNYYWLVLRGTRLGQMTQYQKESNRLIQLLREEYHLE